MKIMILNKYKEIENLIIFQNLKLVIMNKNIKKDKINIIKIF